MFRKLSAEASRLVLEKALTLLDRLIGAFFGGGLSLSVNCLPADDDDDDGAEKVEVVVVAAVLLLVEDLKAETAIILSAAFAVFYCLYQGRNVIRFTESCKEESNSEGFDT